MLADIWPRSTSENSKAWQLDEALAQSGMTSGTRKFQPFYQCAVDPVRIEMDERVVRDLLGPG